MKKVICLILLVSGFAALSATAQIRKIPARVTNSLNVKYPDARNVEWKDRITNCQARFDMNGTRCIAKFSRRGHWLGTEMYVTENNLPLTVKDGFHKSKYRGWHVRSSYVLYEPGQRTRYHVRVAKSDLRQKELVFTNHGQLMKDNISI